MTDDQPYEFYYTGTIDMSEQAFKKRAVAATMRQMPTDDLNDFMHGFVDREQYEEASWVRDEIKRREPKYKVYLKDKDGVMTELSRDVRFFPPKLKL
jgi:hypothetical protein